MGGDLKGLHQAWKEEPDIQFRSAFQEIKQEFLVFIYSMFDLVNDQQS